MKLYDPAVAADRNLYRDLMKEHKEIEPIVEKYRALKKAEASLEDAESKASRKSSKFYYCRVTPTTTAVLSWKFAAAQAARKRRCSPITFTACTTCTPKSAAGKRRSSA